MPAFHVSRSIEIDADTQRVFDTLVDFGTWPTWSPWLLAEREAKLEFAEEPSGKEGWYSWDGEVIGAGKMQHVSSSRPSSPGEAGRMEDQLNFFRPWKSEAKVYFEITPMKGTVSKVTWKMDSAVPFFLFFLKSMIASMVGMDYDRGLRMLKEHLETGTISSETTVHGLSKLEGMTVVGLSDTCELESIGPSMEKIMNQVKEKFSGSEFIRDARWVSLYHKLNLKTQVMRYTTGIMLPAGASVPSGLDQHEIPSMTAFRVSHRGCYAHIGNAWFAAHQHLQAKKIKADRKRPGIEVYVSDPETTPQAECVTDLFIAPK
ncbi:MAG: SRPBCC family protein [Planctomycetota bacterium]